MVYSASLHLLENRTFKENSRAQRFDSVVKYMSCMHVTSMILDVLSFQLLSVIHIIARGGIYITPQSITEGKCVTPGHHTREWEGRIKIEQNSLSSFAPGNTPTKKITYSRRTQKSPCIQATTNLPPNVLKGCSPSEKSVIFPKGPVFCPQ